MGRPRKYATETERLEARRTARREWARRNTDKTKAYYEANKERRSAYHRRWRESNIPKILVDAARKRAEKYSIPFNIDKEYVASIMPERCPVFGTTLAISDGTAGPNSPSLDREYPEKGYVRGNVQVISNRANMMKQNATPEQLKQFALWVLDKY